MPKHVAEGANELVGLLSFNNTKLAVKRFSPPLPANIWPHVEVMPTSDIGPNVPWRTRPRGGSYRNGFAVRAAQKITTTMTYRVRLVNMVG